MITATCDKCDKPIGLVTASTFGAYVIKPGYVGEKHLCGGCYTAWILTVRSFFGV